MRDKAFLAGKNGFLDENELQT